MDDGFYNLKNEYITVDTIKDLLINYYKELHEQDKTKIDDFTDGSEIMNLIGLMSVLAYNMLEEQNSVLANHFINTAEGEYLDLIGTNPNINLERIFGSNATGFVKFSIAEPAISEIEIPDGTIVGSSESSYSTVGDNYISVGETYTYCQVECDVEGPVGNCVVGAITECEDPQFTVTNDEPFTDGLDTEDDEEYRERLLNYVKEDNFGSIGYYENILLNFDGMHDILKYTGETTLSYYLNLTKNENTVYNEVISHFNDANNYVVGHNFTFSLPTKLNTSFQITLNADCGIDQLDIEEYCNLYFIGGDMTNYPLLLLGLDINAEPTIEAFINELKANFDTITNVTIDNLSFKVNSDSTVYTGEDFDDVPSAAGDYYAYRLEGLTVVFE